MRIRILPISIFATLFTIQTLSGCEKPPLPEPAGPPTVEVTPVIRLDGGRELQLSGSLSPDRSIVLGFPTIGVVKNVKVEEGESVKRGQILATLDPRAYRDALGIAEAKAAQAEDAYNRLLPMFQNNTAPEIKKVEVETGLQQARLAVSMARKNLADTKLRASVSGIVASRSIEPGGSAAPGLPAFTLVQTKTIKAVAPVPEMQVGKLTIGAAARIEVPALNKSFDGQIREIGVVANPLTRTYDVEVALPNADGELRIGMIADIHLKIDGEAGIVVPSEAVRVNESGEHYVYVVSAEGKLQQRLVEVSRFIGEDIAVAGNIREGERVVTSGTPMLAEGITVRIRETVAQARAVMKITAEPETETATATETAI